MERTTPIGTECEYFSFDSPSDRVNNLYSLCRLKGGCQCNCHNGSSVGIVVTEKVPAPNQKVLMRNKLNANKDEASQTLSTGDIVITKIYFKENQDKVEEKTLVPTQKK